MSLGSITEDDVLNNGDLVSAIVNSAGGDRITDVDTGALEGIAVTGATEQMVDGSIRSTMERLGAT
jgi:hypothetical protein